jgi:hypothetical protein
LLEILVVVNRLFVHSISTLNGFYILYSGGILPPMFCPNPDGSGPQLTLHQLVVERLSESAQMTKFDQGLTIPTHYIAKAVEETSRDFSRAAVLGNLDLILEREVCQFFAETFKIIQIIKTAESLQFACHC